MTRVAALIFDQAQTKRLNQLIFMNLCQQAKNQVISSLKSIEISDSKVLQSLGHILVHILGICFFLDIGFVQKYSKQNKLLLCIKKSEKTNEKIFQ